MTEDQEEEIDWSRVAAEERKLLYRACQIVIQRTGRTLDQLFREALGFSPSSSANYASSFRAGRISRKHAARIHRWLHRLHPRDAKNLDAEIIGLYVPPGKGSVWERFIEEYGEFERLDVEVIAVPDTRKRHGKIGPGWTPKPTAIAANEMFGFRFESPVEGYIIAFQWLGRGWQTFTLSHSGLGERIACGAHTLPRLDHDDPPGLPLKRGYREPNEFGLHRLVFLVLPFPLAAEFCGKLYQNYRVPEALLDDFARQIAREPRAVWRVWRCDLVFASDPPEFTSPTSKPQRQGLVKRAR